MQAHGEFSIKVQGNIILTKLIGCFNVEGITLYCDAVKKLVIEQFADRPFVMLVDDLEVEGGTPEAFEALNAYNHWMTGQAIVAKALIAHSKTIKQLTLQLSPEIKQQNIQYFTEYESALRWLADELKAYQQA